jgi:hypothetical protein
VDEEKRTGVLETLEKEERPQELHNTAWNSSDKSNSWKLKF